mgnify:CR=1 FL=1
MDISAYLITHQAKLLELETKLQSSDVLNNPTELGKLNREYQAVREIVDCGETCNQLTTTLAQLQTSLRNEIDVEMKTMTEGEIASTRAKLAQIETEFKELVEPADPLDQRNTIVEIRAGTGGDESALFAAELFRMYTRYAERRRWHTQVVSESRSDLGGYKEIIFEITGKRVYSHLKYESGVHRVQRVPATEKNGRVHTSTATVAVLPEAEEVDMNIPAQDIKIEATTSSGHGGQSVNTTYSAIRLVHIPTGMIVICQDERSQKQNKEKAMIVLRARLMARRTEEQRQSRDTARRSQIGSGERSEKIRTYNFPQDRLTDHRVGENWHNLPEIMDGRLEDVVSMVKQKLEE